MYALDTNTVLDYFRGKGGVAARMLTVPPRVKGSPAAFFRHAMVAVDFSDCSRQAVKAAAAYKVRFVTVHAAEGIGLLKAVVQNVPRQTKVLAVTVLTSLSQQDMTDVGMKEELNLADLAVLRARLARDAGCAGVVCSGAEVRKIKQAIGEGTIAVVPAIRPDWSPVSNDDQKRAATPREAVLNGADYIVVGRPIRRAKDPAAAADRIVRELESALREKAGGG